MLFILEVKQSLQKNQETCLARHNAIKTRFCRKGGFRIWQAGGDSVRAYFAASCFSLSR
jgi:hypothetical protein